MKLELETRKCTNKGCSRTFRVLASSKQSVCSNSCSSSPFGAFPVKGSPNKRDAAREEIEAAAPEDAEAAEPAEADSIL